MVTHLLDTIHFLSFWPPETKRLPSEIEGTQFGKTDGRELLPSLHCQVLSSVYTKVRVNQELAEGHDRWQTAQAGDNVSIILFQQRTTPIYNEQTKGDSSKLPVARRWAA